MDDVRQTGLPSGRRRQESDSALLEWWRDYCAITHRSVGGVKVRNQGDGFNKYGVRLR